MKKLHLGLMVGFLCLTPLLPEAKSLTLQIPTRPTQFPLVIDTNMTASTIIAWGGTGRANGQNVYRGGVLYGPSDPVQAVQVDCTIGGAISCLNSDGTCSSLNSYSFGGIILDAPINAITPITNVVQIAGGSYLMKNGTVFYNYSAKYTNVVEIAGTPTNLIGLKNDGTVFIIGSSFFSYQVPKGLTNVVQVAAGNNNSVALKSDGTVVQIEGLSNSIGLTNVVQIAAGGGHTVALKSDGTVVAWGDNSIGQTNVPKGLTNVVQIAAGDYHTAALKNDGTVVTWGDNYYGVITVPNGLTNVLQISAGEYFTVAFGGPFNVNQLISRTSTENTDKIINLPFSFPQAASSGLPLSLTVIQGSASISGDVITPTGLGYLVIAANQSGDYRFAPAQEVDTTYLIDYGSQTIPPLSPIPTQLEATPFSIPLPISSAGLPVALKIKSGPAIISGTTITPTGIGTVVVAADQSGNSSYRAAPEVTTSFKVVEYNQIINPFKTIPTKTLPCAPFTVTLPTTTSGLPATLSVISGSATVKGKTVTVTGAGTIVLAADQSGNSKYNAAPEVTTSFVVQMGQQKINPFKTIPSKKHGTSFTVTPPTSSSKLPVLVTVLSGPATCSGNLVTLTGSGYVTLAADQGGSQNYNAAPEVTTTFFVQ